jgi:hypothetical protein
LSQQITTWWTFAVPETRLVDGQQAEQVSVAVTPNTRKNIRVPAIV